MVIISESEKSTLKDRARKLLSKPIKFFNEMKELFPPPMPSNSDVALWQRLEKMTITTDQKLLVGTFLASNEQKGMRDFLSASAEITFQSWVFKFLSDSGCEVRWLLVVWLILLYFF
ncbi:hypothetical protein BAE44_0011988 [Dichanthelium oligosanthes]|uniref:Uncharacterized protein n=1 Tax=Dichanthelium oligosanthes TaxID=888268 RepID=A0A1E5VPF3_9POAL|nr:hypothetical protein BAE44_0011988 [Dichanthelium oligosanthes]